MAPKLKTVYEKAEEIPEGYNELYAERGGKFELVEVEGVKTQADIDRINEALRKEKTDHKAAKEKLQKFGEIDPDQLPAQLEELIEAKARLNQLTAEGKLDETKIAERIEAAVNRAVGPIDRDKKAVERALEAERKKVEAAQGEISKRDQQILNTKIEQSLREGANVSKILPTAIDDAVLLSARYFEVAEDGRTITRADSGVTPGLDPKEFFKDMQEKKPHWWPVSQGGGSRGAGGATGFDKGNPWSEQGWNVTGQGAYVKQHGPEKAAQAAASVGSKLGATRPTPKAAA